MTYIGTIVMPAADLSYDANHWAELILREKVTLWDTVPALVQLLVDQAGPGLYQQIDRRLFSLGRSMTVAGYFEYHQPGM